MNVIIIRRYGLIDDTPILVKNDTTAEIVFESLVNELLGSDDFRYFGDDSLNKANELLSQLEIQIDWFIDVEINTYKN